MESIPLWLWILGGGMGLALLAAPFQVAYGCGYRAGVEAGRQEERANADAIERDRSTAR